jgi:hypothetical protein
MGIEQSSMRLICGGAAARTRMLCASLTHMYTWLTNARRAVCLCSNEAKMH